MLLQTSRSFSSRVRTQAEGEEPLGRAPLDLASSRGPQCLRGHPLVFGDPFGMLSHGLRASPRPEEEVDGPPKQCGFCKTQTQTSFKCSQDCYFHACQELHSCMSCSMLCFLLCRSACGRAWRPPESGEMRWKRRKSCRPKPKALRRSSKWPRCEALAARRLRRMTALRLWPSLWKWDVLGVPLQVSMLRFDQDM